MCDAIIDTVCERGECDFVRDIAAPLPMVMIGDALGVAPEDRDDLLRWSDDMVSGAERHRHRGVDDCGPATRSPGTPSTPATSSPTAREPNPTDDLMSVLVHAEVDGDRSTTTSSIHESLLILIGGDETTRHVISGGMCAAAAHPDQRDGSRADRDLHRHRGRGDAALGHRPSRTWPAPSPATSSSAASSMHEGQKLLLLYPSANRDEDVFDDPFRFDIERSPNDHVAFGFGTPLLPRAAAWPGSSSG